MEPGPVSMELGGISYPHTAQAPTGTSCGPPVENQKAGPFLNFKILKVRPNCQFLGVSSWGELGKKRLPNLELQPASPRAI